MLLQPLNLILLYGILLYVFVRTADISISSAIARDVGRAIAYGILLLILIVGMFALFRV